MDKLKMHSPDLSQENIAKIREMFPGCVTEARDKATGAVRLAVDFDQLRQELNDDIAEGLQERYRLDWPGKREALALANAPINKSLRPAREESVDFDTTQNLFIEGDNLDALKLLQQSHLGEIKLIYIDPPYNTGSDFIYKDDYCEYYSSYLTRSEQVDPSGNKLVSNSETNGRFHSDWLSMMFSRVRIARNLLSEDGVIAVHMDENEYANIEKLLTEVFGEKNNLGTIVWDKRNPKGDATRVAQQHEYISLYVRDYECFRHKVDFRRPKENSKIILDKAAAYIKLHGGVNSASREAFKKWLSAQDFSGGEKAYYLIDENSDVYRTVSMAWPNKKKAPDDYFIPLVHPVTGKECPVPKRGWRNSTQTMKSLLDADQVVFGPDEKIQPTRKYLLKENTKENIPSLMYFGGSDDGLISQMGLAFDHPKPVQVARRIIQSVTSGRDLVLDFFAGSGTCAHAMMELNASSGSNLRFILVQLASPISDSSVVTKTGCQTIADLCKERIRRAGNRIADGGCHPDWKRDVGFRMLKVETSNMKDVYYRPDVLKQSDLLDTVDNVKEGRTAEDLLFQVLVDWGVDLTLPIRRETVQGKAVFFVDDNALVACFDPGVSEDLVKELAGHEPLRVVFRDNGFASDVVKINVEQIFHQISPTTDVKSI